MMQHCVKDLNHLYKEEPALHEKQFEQGGFEWVDLNHRDDCVIAYRRLGEKPKDDIIVILNMKDAPHSDYEITVKGKKKWKQIFNSDSTKYWGESFVSTIEDDTEVIDKDGKIFNIKLNLPPLAGIVLK